MDKINKEMLTKKIWIELDFPQNGEVNTWFDNNGTMYQRFCIPVNGIQRKDTEKKLSDLMNTYKEEAEWDEDFVENLKSKEKSPFDDLKFESIESPEIENSNSVWKVLKKWLSL